MIKVHSELQLVYTSLASKSAIFHKCLESDLRLLGTDFSLDISQLRLCSEELLTVRFFFEEIQQISGKSCTRKHTVMELMKYVRSLERKDVPVVFLDEVVFASISPDNIDAHSFNIKRMKFARNLLRACGLPVVLMGTNSNAAVFMELSQQSRRKFDASNVWCKLIARLPALTDVSMNCLGVSDCLNKIEESHTALNVFFKKQFYTCIPLFVELFVHVTSKFDDPVYRLPSSELFDAIISGMAREPVACKPFLQSRDGMRGQLCMHLPAFKEPSDHAMSTRGFDEYLFLQPSKTSSFVATHFASLEKRNINLVKRGDKLYDESSGGSHVWVPRAWFPHADRDALLYLMLMGGKGKDFESPFLLDGSPCSTLSAFTEQLEVSSQEQYRHARVMDYIRRRDGDLLEALVAVAMIVASHRNGVRGMVVMDFLQSLTMELLPGCARYGWNSSVFSFFSEDFLNFVVPFLSPVNSPWPNYIHDVPNTRFATLQRPPNRDRIDFNVIDCCITGEAKNHERSIDLATLRGMLVRIPMESRLHLVFCSSLQSEYFTESARKSWSEFSKENKNLDGMCFLKVSLSKSDKMLTLSELFKGASHPDRKYSRLAVFFDLEGMVSQEE